MANQMIALQARNPQLPDPSRAAAQYANMMNMASQQRASQLQGERIRQEMEYARAGEARAAETQVLDIRGKQLANEDKELARLYKMGAAILETEDPTAREAAYQNLLGLIEKTSPQLGATMRQVASTFNPNVLQAAMMETEQYFNKKYSTPIDSLEIREDGTPVSVQVGGLNPQQRPIYDAPPPMTAAPRATPTAPQAAPPSGPIPTGKFGETRVIRPESIPLTPDQQDHIRRMQEGLGMTNTPASFTRGGATTPTVGQMSPDMVPAILDSAINTGVMAQIDLDQMLALAPPQARQGIMDVIRDNKIALQADAPSLAASAMSQQQPMAPNPVGRQQSQFADMRGPAPQASLADLGGQPEMRNVMAQTQPRTVSKLRLRDPNVSPLPGSSRVPLSRVAGEAEARRETPAQITARKNAELTATEAFEETNKDARLRRKREEVFEGERAKKDAEFLATYNDATTKSRTTLNVIDQMIGDARLEKGRLVVPKGGRRPHPGFEGVVGIGVPGVRFIPGTAAASFDALFGQAEGGAFLKAFDDLRGGGSITVTEGEKATSALTRMKRSQSEAEFVKAAREFADVLRVGIERADKKYTKLTGEAPLVAAPPRKTPTKSSGGWGKAKVVGN